MRIEQGVEFRAPLGRRGQRRMAGAADIGDAGRAEEIDGGEKGRRLLRRDQEAVMPQQRREADEGLQRARQGRQVAHAAISAIIASRRGAM